MSVQLWQHKPVVKQAVEWDGDNAAEIIEWAPGKAYLDELRNLVICTPQGEMIPAIGDFIVRGIEGEYYPVPRSIFLGSYDYVGERS